MPLQELRRIDVDSARAHQPARGVSRIWRAFGLKPHLVDSFKLSPDPHFVERVRDVVGLYLNPPEGALVLCVDEKTPVRALDRTAPILPLRPGPPERRTRDYRRNGTTNLYAALDIASGKVIADMTERHRALEFRRFLNLINRNVPKDLDVHVVVGNPSTHKTPEIHRWLLRHSRFTLHFTPTYSSWTNLIWALVRRAHQQVVATRNASLHQRTRSLHHPLGRNLEPRTHTIRVAQEHRRDPRHARRLLRADL